MEGGSAAAVSAFSAAVRARFLADVSAVAAAGRSAADFPVGAFSPSPPTCAHTIFDVIDDLFMPEPDFAADRHVINVKKHRQTLLGR